MKAIAGAAATVLAKSGLLRLLESTERTPDRVRVIAYHRVDEPDAEPDLDPGLLSTTPSEFRVQAEIAARHYNPISLDDLAEAHRGEKRLPPRSILFTFDDAYLDFAEYAWPTLRSLGIPAVLFVPTAFPDIPGPGFWWDRLHSALRRTKRSELTIPELGSLPLAEALQRRAAHRTIRNHVKSQDHTEAMDWLEHQLHALADLPSLHRVLGWDELRSLAREGVSVCSHSHAHALCTQLPPETLADDLSLARSVIERELGADAPPPAFAYPSGAHDDASRAAVAKAGYELAFGGDRRIDRLPLSDPQNVTRLPMLRYSTDLFRAQLRPSVAGIGRVLIDGGSGKAA
jgi:peptidoglycan/xylan/chitin deacetylase (PgdA/CDA1 family)